MTGVTVTGRHHLHHDCGNGDAGVSDDALTHFIFVASSGDVGVPHYQMKIQETGCLVTTKYLVSFFYVSCERE